MKITASQSFTEEELLAFALWRGYVEGEETVEEFVTRQLRAYLTEFTTGHARHLIEQQINEFREQKHEEIIKPIEDSLKINIV